MVGNTRDWGEMDGMAEHRRTAGSDGTLSYRFHMINNNGSCHCMHANTSIGSMNINVNCEL